MAVEKGNKSMEHENRLEYIDVLKGLGILIMIMGHVEDSLRFDHFIHGFHMQIFFFASGLLFRDRPVEEIKTSVYIKSKAKKTLLPYCIWGIISYIIWIFRWGNRGWKPLGHLLFENTIELPISGALWFLTAFFLTSVIYFCLNRYIKDARLRTALIAVIALVGNIAPNVLPFRLPYAMDSACVGVGLIHTGYLAKQYLYKGNVDAMKTQNVFLTIATGGIVTILIFTNDVVNLRTGEYGNIPLFWINSTGASVVGLQIAVWLSQCRNKILYPIISFVKRVGRNSIIYLCLNQLALWEVDDAVKNIDSCLEFVTIEGMLYSVIVFVMIMILLSIADQIISRTSLKWCFGQ